MQQWERQDSRSASIMTRSSTRPPTFSTWSQADFSPWIGFNWRYDSRLVAGAIPCYNAIAANTLCGSTTLNGQPAVDLSGLTGDEEFEAGFACNGIKATPTTPCPQPASPRSSLPAGSASRRPTPRTTTRTRLGSRREACSMPPSATTTFSTATSANGVFASPPSTSRTNMRSTSSIQPSAGRTMSLLARSPPKLVFISSGTCFRFPMRPGRAHCCLGRCSEWRPECPELSVSTNAAEDEFKRFDGHRRLAQRSASSP